MDGQACCGFGCVPRGRCGSCFHAGSRSRCAERACRNHGPGRHGSIVTPPILARIHDLGVCISPHSYIYNHGEKLEAFGARRFDWIEPNRHALDAGICIGGSSDSPVSPPRVMERIQSLVTRRALSNGKVYGVGQELTVAEALRTFTMGSAYMQFEEGERGSIAPGKRADLVVLSADPEKVPPEQIHAIRVLKTVAAGRLVYDASRKGKARFGW